MSGEQELPPWFGRRRRTAVEADFAVTDEVWQAVRAWPTTVDIRPDGTQERRCAVCAQSLYITARKGLSYHYTGEQVDGLTFAHLAQRHGFTREQVPEHV